MLDTVGSLQLNVILAHMWGDIRYSLPQFNIPMSELKNMEDVDFMYADVLSWFHTPPHNISNELHQKLRFFRSMLNAINASFNGNPLW